MFNTRFEQYRFQLTVEWVQETGALGIFLILHRANVDNTNEEGDLDSFAVQYSLELLDGKGKVMECNTLSALITLALL